MRILNEVADKFKEMGMEQSNTVLSLQNITKVFPGVRALDHVSLDAQKGEVLAICGENGAGKSTLMKIITGLYQPDHGDVIVKGEKVKIHNPQEAKSLGITMVHQECQFVPEMSVSEMLFMGDLPITKMRSIDWKTIKAKARDILSQENLISTESFPYGLKTSLKHLSISEIQLLQIVKVVSEDSDIIIMDEPTSSLAKHEADILLRKVVELRNRGKCILYISHKMDEIFQIADRIAVFRDGYSVGVKIAKKTNIDEIITMMVGRKLSKDYPKATVPIADELFRAENICKDNVFHDVSLRVHGGEIVGIAGLVGAGRTEVARSIFGLDPIDKGQFYVREQEVFLPTVHHSIGHGIAMLSEDRRKYGLVLIRSVKENISLPNLKKFFKKGWLFKKKETDAVSAQCASLQVKAPSINSMVQHLSGGNQQKVVLAKWLLKESSLLILDEPTRGIDVGAKYEIYKLMTTLAAQGRGILMISSELPELLGMCDRIYVMAKGKFTAELSRDEFSQEVIMQYATGVKQSNKGGEEKV